MEFIDVIIQSLTYFGVFERLMALSSTEIAVLFLLSKPVFILTAGLLVVTQTNILERHVLPGASRRREALLE